jgi:signal transduction histidine kinase
MKIPRVRVSLETGTVYQGVLESGKPLIMNDPAIIQRSMAECTDNKILHTFIPAVQKIVGYRSVIAVPLVSEGEIIGILDMGRREPFTGSDLQRFEVIAEHLTALIKRKLAEEAVGQRAAQLAILNDVGSKIAALLDLDSVLERAVHLVQESFGYHHVSVFTLDPRQEVLVMRTRAGDFAHLFPLDHRLKLHQGVVGWAGYHGETLLANDVNAEPRYVNLYPDLVPTRSELCVPIKVSGEIVGVLDAQSPQINAFDESDVMVMETLADQIAVAIENARLYETVEEELVERKRAEEALQQYSERLEDMVEERTQELRDAQEELVRKEKLATLGQLAGSIGHELRNPLGAIKNAVYFLNLVLEDPDHNAKDALEILNKEVERATRIISSLLDFARKRPPTHREVNVNDVIQATLARAMVPEHIKIVRQLDESLPVILADPDQLSQVFDNIILNSIQAMPEPGQLTIETSIQSNGVTISFTDTGTGIHQDIQAKIFDPLFTTKAKGIGLGLSLVKDLVEGHRGTIAVKSEEGKGSTFTIQLPASVSDIPL